MQDLLRRRIANTLDDDKEYLANARLAPVARRLDHESISELMAAVRSGHRPIQDQVIEAMTINETSFFRDSHPFRALRDEIIPGLLRAGPRPLRMWSAATSTGQEAYSLAILMVESFPHAPAPEILGTDVAESVLARARTGSFSQLEVNRGLPARSLVTHFEQVGRTWRLKPHIAGMVRFERLNLSRPWPALPRMDVILLRNVLLYFDRDTRAAVLGRAIAALRPGGHLILGGAETGMLDSTAVDRVTYGQTVCFRAR